MRITIRSPHVTIDQDQRQDIAEAVRTALAHVESRVVSVQVLIDDSNGPKGGVDQRCEFVASWRMGETDDLVIARMAFQKDGRVRIDGLCVVLRACLVCRADFPENRAALLNDIGQTERSADLDQFTSRCDHFPALRGGHKAEEDRRGAIVHNQSGFSTGKLADEMFDMRVARAAPSCIQIQFEI